ncbi:pheromone alpha factor receptor [Gnomoniopsis smithogilvyi]|uniref:Pheromone alpha factor receptor n=1 Tax=Gnomoniopsis smithogilvyi TaxID=1191159 RepID=A0A9W8Z1X9_9PEZI|nr:pheromone alpha factor receptor [Gnomoniopsis smithogilvyi]
MADSWNQTIQIILSPEAGGTKVPVFLSAVDQNNKIMITQTIGYGTEIGASILMLVIILVMTPKTKFWRFSTYLNIVALCNNIIRLILLVIYFESTWVGFYALYSGDYSFVSKTDFNNSIASTVMGIPQNIMIMLALMLQAWAMVRFWPQAYKWCIFLVSVVLVLLEIGFMVASEAYQIITFYESAEDAYSLILQTAWVRYTYLGLEVSCICWFCFLFIAKLATHLWNNRSFLPTSKGLGAMDALVTTNGVLMLIPLFFAGLQYSAITYLQLGSMVYTSVLIVLPLGCLVAQRIADPAAFNSESSVSARVNQNPNDRFGAYASNKNGLLAPSWSQSDKDSAVFPGRRGSSNAITAKNGITATITSGTHLNSRSIGRLSPSDVELARIDADFEAGQVRVDHEIRQEVL